MDACASVLEIVELPMVAFFDVEDSSFLVRQRLIEAVRSAVKCS
jgi:hypothetical protein